MKIKTKLNLGVGLLCLSILVLTIVSSFYVFSIKKDTQNILTANYNTLEYSRNMLLALDKMGNGGDSAVDDFEENLSKQVKNITEAGEDLVTNDIQKKFIDLKARPQDVVIRAEIRQDIFEIMKLNMNAIKGKSEIANTTAETGNLWISITGCLCFLIAFNLLVNLPNNIANPILELTESIKAIANKNYSERVHFENQNEFGELARSFNTMAEKLEEYNNSNLFKLSLEKKRLETLIDNMHDPVIGLDNNGRILFANNEALKISGLGKEDVIGKSAHDVSSSNDLMRDIFQNSQSESKLMKIFADGKESYFEKEAFGITIVPTGEENPVKIGDVLILRNVTIFKELDFAKTNFIATVSHELKTPIASVKLSLNLLENPDTGEINEDQRQLIHSIKDDAQRLLRITSELLELSQVETGKIQLDIRESDPYGIIEYAVDAVKIQSDQKQIRLFSEAQDNLPKIKADAEKTSWVLINFLTNAIRYSLDGSEIKISVNQVDDDVRFEVIDSGKGIDKRYVPKIFDKYFQVPGSHKTGTGLGLAISKEFIEAQGGSVGVESQLGMGSSFYFSLKRFDA
ncbi:MAG: PAS domain-containing protein [Flavobacterium sp.]|uniref:sensor histidine kinase n=1 Tax=Flavobacterium sp. TaxID=239 RepID=UPI0011F8B3DA|nr:ATP-binding protein [Flavobacterium sp.]RZJ65862.1 MAG: PAS domain-containing protein [Flavobacterium sp.]